LDSEEELKGLSDLSDVFLPEINLIIELLVLGRALHVAQHHDVVFDNLIHILSAHDLVVVLVVGLALKLLNFKVGNRIIFPDASNLLELDFDLKLFAGVISKLVNLLTMVVKAELEDLLEGEFGGVLVELLLYLKLEFHPMTLTHCLVSEVGNEWHGCVELVNLILKEVEDAPLANFLLKSLDLLLEFDGVVIHVFDLKLIEEDYLPLVPFGVPLLLHGPNL
jgi:hypothetical protein